MATLSPWRAVWEQPRTGGRERDLLTRLLIADGFHGPGGVATAAWRAYLAEVEGRMRLSREASLFEVGCGAGAFLWPFHQQGRTVGGVDYSSRQVRRAAGVMPTGGWSVGEADSLDPSPRYGAVIANSVFQYFPDFSYAERVLRLMAAKSAGPLAILDVPDAAQSERILQTRRAALPPGEYDRLYAGLCHLMFPRDWFHNVLGSNARIEDQCISGYRHAPVRFNVFVR